MVKSFRGKRLNVISGKLGAEWSEQKNRRKIALNHAEYRRSKILHERILPLSGCVAKKIKLQQQFIAQSFVKLHGLRKTFSGPTSDQYPCVHVIRVGVIAHVVAGLLRTSDYYHEGELPTSANRCQVKSSDCLHHEPSHGIELSGRLFR